MNYGPSIDYTQKLCFHPGPFDYCLGQPDWTKTPGQLWKIQYGVIMDFRFAPTTPDNQTQYGPRYWYPVI
jgi:hypothetical protein